MSLYADIAWGRTTKLDQEELNRRAKIVADAIEALRAFAPSWEAEVEALRSVGLDRINNALLPAYQQIIDIANLGALLSTSSDSSVTIGNGAKTFVVPETKRLNFAPTPYLIAYANGDFDLSMIGTVSSYSSETGQLVIAVESSKGEGTFTSWNIGPVATTADLEALRDELQAEAAAAAASAAAADSSADASAASADASAASATSANASKVAAEGALASFQSSYLGARSTEPGGAALGALYLDTSQTPNVVKVLTETGWAPTVTVSIGGSRQQMYIATAGQTGPFTVDGGFTNGAVNVNGVDLYHDHGVTLNAANGTFTLATPRDAGDVIVFKGYLANDAVDVFVKSEANERFVTGKQAQAFTAAEKGRARGNIGADILAGFRNKIINGDFDFWQRGDNFAPQTASRYGPDRWVTNASFATIGLSRQAFTLGQTDVPGEPEFFCRVTCSVGNDFGALTQRIENVRTLAGKKVTVTFWAKGTNPGGGKFYTYFFQTFGTGGTAAGVESATREFSVTSSWQKFQFVIDLPSVAGKTIGPGSSVWVAIGQYADWSTAAWTLDVAHVSVVEGDATGEADPFSPRHPQQELALCQRYFEKSYNLDITPGSVANPGMVGHRVSGLPNAANYAQGIPARFAQRKRALPSVVVYSPLSGASGKAGNFAGTLGDVNASTSGIGEAGFIGSISPNTQTLTETNFAFHFTADAEL